MMHAEVNSVLEKIDDCDFDGAVSEMYRLAKLFSENGKPEYSDFLAYFASVSHKTDDLRQDTKPSSEVEPRLDVVERKQADLKRKIYEVIMEVFSFFEEMESIAVCEFSGRPPVLGFYPQAKDNFLHIERFVKGQDSYVNLENLEATFSNQISFYRGLKPAGVHKMSNHKGRVTNILPGKFWRFRELCGGVRNLKRSLAEVASLKEEINRLHSEAQELRGYCWINEVSSRGFKESFLKSLKAFKDTGRISLVV